MTPSLQQQIAQIASLVEQETPNPLRLRHSIHQHPELSHQEFETTARIEQALAETHARVRRGPAGVGLIVDIGPPNLPQILVRGDIDALAIQEDKRACLFKASDVV